MTFLDSFKFKKNFLYIIGYDLLFYIIAVIFVKLFGFIIEKMSSGVDMSILNRAVLDPSPAQVEIVTQTVMGAKAVVYVFAIFVVLYLVILLFAWSLSRGLIYCTLLKKKFNSKYYWKFLLLNLVFFVPLLIMFFSFVYVIKELPYAIYVLMFLILAVSYFLTLSYIKFDHKVFKAIGSALEFGFTKIHKMLIPFVLILLMFFVMSFITSGVNRMVSFGLKPYVSVVLFVVYMAWARIYFVRVVEKLKI